MSRKYSRRNYHEALEKILPDIYKEEDLKLANEQEELASKILYADMDYVIRFDVITPLVKRFSEETTFSSLGLSGWNNTDYTDRSLTSVYTGYSEGLIKHFIPQNKLTYIEPNEFNIEIMSPLGYDINDYATSADFVTFLSGTLFPKLKLGEGSSSSESLADYVTELDGTFGSDYSEVASYLINSLGLFQLLNYNRDTVGIHAIYAKFLELASNIFTEKLYVKKEPVTLEDAINVLTEISFAFPVVFQYQWVDEFKVDPTETFLSGTQSLEKRKTWNSILYGITDEEQDDAFTKEFYINYFESKNDDLVPYVKQGPFKKFLKALGFVMGDLDNQILSLKTLNSIEECPPKYLPYLADQVGWKFYTSNVDSWRRQLRDSRNLLKKKGTKQGLIDLMKSILPATEVDFDNNFSEYYESYIPNLIYYLLKTEADELQSFDDWNQIKANEYAGGEINYDDLDESIRFVVDHTLLEAVHKFPDLFSVKGYKFDTTHPDFVFNYRGRDFHIPPFEDERFYKDCDVTYDLISFFKSKLVCLGVEDSIADSFESYILQNTIEGYQEPDLYNNGFLFLTKYLNTAPNYDRIMEDYDQKFYDYLPLWNGKSSQFNLTVSSGAFDDKFFVQTAYTTEDFFESLKAIRDFVPAKAIERININLENSDVLYPYVKMQPRITTPFADLPNVSGAMASFELSTLDMRDASLGLLGTHIDPSYDFAGARTTNNHENLPVFTRDRVLFGRTSDQAAWKDTSGIYNVSGPYGEVAPRSASRRRDFQKNLSKGQIFRRDGFNPPSFLNVRTKGSAEGVSTFGSLSSLVEFVPLGLIPSSQEFTTVPDHKNVPDVYNECEDTTSNNVFNGIRSKYTFKIRGDRDALDIEPAPGVIDDLVYKYRDNIEDIYKLIFELKDEELRIKAELILKHNAHLVKNGMWKDELESFKNKLWNSLDYSIEEDFHKLKMDVYSRVPSEDDKPFNYLYLNDYVKYGKGNISNSVLDDLDYGGSSIVSHIYGPIFYNGMLKVDGSSIGKVYQSVQVGKDTLFDDNIVLNNKIQSLDQDYEFPIRYADTDLIDNYFQVGAAPEEYTPHFLSGIELVTFRTSDQNKVSLYDLSSDEGFLEKGATLLDGNLITLKSREFLPRLRFTFNHGSESNFLRPDHKFSVEISSLFLNEDDMKAGGRTASVWIHTDIETDYYGKQHFWNYMPNGKWERIDLSSVQGQEGISYVRNKLVHNFLHPNKTIERKGSKSCYIDSVNKEVLYSLSNSDFEVNRVEFDTLNRKVKLPLEYYQYKNQLHRADQKYMVEVFTQNTPQESNFFSFKGLKCVDETMNRRAHVRKRFDITDYSLTKKPTNKRIEFFYPNGKAVPLGTTIYAQLDGYLYAGNDPITASISINGTRVFYEKVFVGFVTYVTAPLGEVAVQRKTFEGYVVVNGYEVDECLKVDGVPVDQTLTITVDNIIEDFNASGLGQGISDIIPAVQIRKAIKVPSGGTGCKFNYPSDWGIGTTEFSVSSIASSTPFGDSYTILSANNITRLYPTTSESSYIKNDIGGSYLFSSNQITYDPEAEENYLGFSSTCIAFNGVETSGYIDSDTPGGGVNLHSLFIQDSKKSRFEDYDFDRELVFYEPADNFINDNHIVFTSVFRVRPSSPSIISLGVGMGGFSPHHDNQRILQFNYFVDDEVVRLDIPLQELGETGKSPFGAIGYPTQANEFYEGSAVPIHFSDSPIVAGYAGLYDMGDGWKLLFFALNADSMVEFTNSTPTVYNQDSIFYAIESLNTPAKISFGMFNQYEDSLGNPGEVDVAHIGINSVLKPTGYTFPFEYFTNTQTQQQQFPIIEGVDKGNYITSSVDYNYLMDPEKLITMFRFYNSVSDELQSRDSSKTELSHGPNGGGRSNYRIHPAEFATDRNKFLNTGTITEINITN